MKPSANKLLSSWFLFWEGVVIDHFWGIRGSAIWCLAWFALAGALRLGYAVGKKAT